MYAKKHDLELESTADYSPWEPSDDIKKLVENYANIEVELITKETSLNGVNKTLRECKDVGLVLMGQSINRYSKPSVIVLTTSDKFYVIDPNDSRGISFLQAKKTDDGIQFYTTNGRDEADCLYHNYQIDLNEFNSRCCTGSHIYLIRTLQCMPEPGRLFYTPQAFVKANRSEPRIETFEELVETWLDINKEDIEIDRKQLPHLDCRPLNLTAINLMKKRCILVRALAKKLDYYCWREATLMSKTAFRRLVDIEDEQVHDYLSNFLSEQRQEGRVDIGHYAHLNCGPTNRFGDD